MPKQPLNITSTFDCCRNRWRSFLASGRIKRVARHAVSHIAVPKKNLLLSVSPLIIISQTGHRKGSSESRVFGADEKALHRLRMKLCESLGRSLVPWTNLYKHRRNVDKERRGYREDQRGLDCTYIPRRHSAAQSRWCDVVTIGKHCWQIYLFGITYRRNG